MEKKSGIGNSRRLDSILRYANKNGYKDVIYRGKFEKFSVYELILSEELIYIGIPQYIMDDGQKIRVSSPDEAFKILDWLEKEHIE